MTSRQTELYQVAQYLRGHAKTDFENMPEKTVAAVLNKLSPEARKAFATQYMGLDHARESGGRLAPFEEKMDMSEGLPDPLLKTIGKIDTERAITSLNERMGTSQAQERINNEPPSLRDAITASVDVHEGDSNG